MSTIIFEFQATKESGVSKWYRKSGKDETATLEKMRKSIKKAFPNSIEIGVEFRN